MRSLGRWIYPPISCFCFRVKRWATWAEHSSIAVNKVWCIEHWGLELIQNSALTAQMHSRSSCGLVRLETVHLCDEREITTSYWAITQYTQYVWRTWNSISNNYRTNRFYWVNTAYNRDARLFYCFMSWSGCVHGEEMAFKVWWHGSTPLSRSRNQVACGVNNFHLTYLGTCCWLLP